MDTHMCNSMCVANARSNALARLALPSRRRVIAHRSERQPPPARPRVLMSAVPSGVSGGVIGKL